MRRQRDELIEAPPFTVWGISSPALYPCSICGQERDAAGWKSMTLGYGDAEAVPSISVRSSLRRTQAPELDPLSGRQSGSIVVAGTRRDVELLTDGARWAATIAVADVRVTVIGAGVLPETVWLVPVDDLALYRRPVQAPWLAGLDPQRVLLDALSNNPDSLPRRHFLRWRRAVAAQRLLADGDRYAAVATLHDLLTHVAALRALPWAADPALRRAATEETLRYACTGADVASRNAQNAWQAGESDAWRLAWSAWSVSPERDASSER
jgi:hypothetical protein